VEESSARILIDPGAYSENRQDSVTGLHAILITHEHQDHCDVASIKNILAKNPQVRIFTNRGVGVVLDTEGIKYELLEEGKMTIEGVAVEAFGHEHAQIHRTIPIVLNTGYFIGDRFAYSGDALTLPLKSVEILALPVVAPWGKSSDFIDYATVIKPKICFPVHDGFLSFGGPFHAITSRLLRSQGIAFEIFAIGEAKNV
jgi:L-ascorbate metabolism protein UlaG (beta-lactamase superfamily)